MSGRAKLETKAIEPKREVSVSQIKKTDPSYSKSPPNQVLSLQRNLGNQAFGRFIQTKLKIGEPGDVYEQEADRVADEIMRMPDRAVSASGGEGNIQRKCAACASGSSCSECEEEEEMTIHRKAEHTPDSGGSVPDSFIQNLGPGQPLDNATRNFFEPRFGHDFSRVRVHNDMKAAESASKVNALAYTVGRNIAFGAGQYKPGAKEGNKLLAHELTHVVQQSATAADNGRLLPPKMLQRACISDPECEPAAPGALPGTAVKGSATHFVAEVVREEKELAEKEKRKTPEDIRKELCEKQPPDPKCTSDGHGRLASAFEELFRPYAPTQLKLAKGVFVDKDIKKGFGAYVWDCRNFVPKIEGVAAGDQCIFIPEHLENNAILYNKGEKTITGRDREEWLTRTLSTFMHEVEHVRFEKEFPKAEPRPGACKFEDVSGELTELAAIMSEFPVRYRSSAKKPWHERRADLNAWFRRQITQPRKHGEAIAGILKAIRCRCECVDVDAYVKKTVEFTTGSWTEDEKNTFHTELRSPNWKLDWPIETTLPPRDIPAWMLTPSFQLGYGSFGGGGGLVGLGLDVGIPLDRLGKWQLLLGAQGRVISGLGDELRTTYLYGLKVGFLRGPALGTSGLQFGAFGEIGGGRFTSPLGGPKKEEGGAYAGGGLSLRYSPGLDERGLIPFVGLEVGVGARIDTTKPEVQKLFFTGLSFGVQW